jgi:nitroreductase
MDLNQAIASRRAVRQYADTPVDEHVIAELIDIAVQAPSAMNRQAWHFTVVTDKQLLDEISAKSKAYLLSKPSLTHGEHDLHRMLSDPAFDIFYDAPVLVVISASGDAPWTIEDCALAAQNLMLAARAAELGSCWIGLAQAWLETTEGKALLALPSECTPVAPIILGHPSAWPAPVPRKSPSIRWLRSRSR